MDTKVFAVKRWWNLFKWFNQAALRVSHFFGLREFVILDEPFMRKYRGH